MVLWGTWFEMLTSVWQIPLTIWFFFSVDPVWLFYRNNSLCLSGTFTISELSTSKRVPLHILYACMCIYEWYIVFISFSFLCHCLEEHFKGSSTPNVRDWTQGLVHAGDTYCHRLYPWPLKIQQEWRRGEERERTSWSWEGERKRTSKSEEGMRMGAWQPRDWIKVHYTHVWKCHSETHYFAQLIYTIEMQIFGMSVLMFLFSQRVKLEHNLIKWLSFACFCLLRSGGGGLEIETRVGLMMLARHLGF